MHITLQKRDKGQTWSSPILGQGQLDPYSTDLEQKRLMLQRFQEEDRVTKRLTGKPKSIAFPLSQFLERPFVIDSSARPRETETLELIRETPRSLRSICSFDYHREAAYCKFCLTLDMAWEDVIYKWEFDLFYIKVGSELKHFCINPVFDFSQAHFLGSCPDPRTFMGGIRAD
ncbi:hypothetical protein Goshw_006917 [Gossypium schwendimanii]|uniref:CS domain-containing protein n=1 Tax=Gossypium schwendimanii TaxID=34291 RepID=A0A7J9LE13_GOSSC|nr:hypothetical protein [Gossypium schwendimanii]